MSYDAVVFWLGIFMGFTAGRAFAPIWNAFVDFCNWDSTNTPEPKP